MINLITWVFQPPTNQTDFLDMLTYFNNLTDVGQGGMFFTVMLIVFGGILFMMMRAWGSEKSFGITSIVVCIIAWLFRLMSWVNDYMVTVATILMIFGVYLLIKQPEPE